MTSFSKSFGLTELGMKELKWRNDVLTGNNQTKPVEIDHDIEEGDEDSNNGSNKEEELVHAMEESAKKEKETVERQAKTDLERILKMNEVGGGSGSSRASSRSSSSSSSASVKTITSTSTAGSVPQASPQVTSTKNTVPAAAAAAASDTTDRNDDNGGSNADTNVVVKKESVGVSKGASRAVIRIEANNGSLSIDSLPIAKYSASLTTAPPSRGIVAGGGVIQPRQSLLGSNKKKSNKKKSQKQRRGISKLKQDESGGYHYYLNNGEHVGGECIINGTPMDTTVMACGDVTCFVLTRTDLISLFNETHMNKHIEKTNLINEMFIKKATIRAQPLTDHSTLSKGTKLSRGDKISRARRSDVLNKQGTNFGVVTKVS